MRRFARVLGAHVDLEVALGGEPVRAIRTGVRAHALVDHLRGGRKTFHLNSRAKKWFNQHTHLHVVLQLGPGAEDLPARRTHEDLLGDELSRLVHVVLPADASQDPFRLSTTYY